MNVEIVILLVALTPAASGQAGRRVAPATLAEARSAFQAADRDRNGLLVLAEALTVGRTRAEFALLDLDGNTRVTRDEFVLGYRSIARGKGRGIAADLETEAKKLTAARSRGGAGRGPAARRLRRADGPAVRRGGPDPPPAPGSRRVSGGAPDASAKSTLSGSKSSGGRSGLGPAAARERARRALSGSRRSVQKPAKKADASGSTPETKKGRAKGEGGAKPVGSKKPAR